MIRASKPIPKVSDWARRFVDPEPDEPVLEFEQLPGSRAVPVYAMVRPRRFSPWYAYLAVVCGVLGLAAPPFWIAAFCFGIAAFSGR